MSGTLAFSNSTFMVCQIVLKSSLINSTKTQIKKKTQKMHRYNYMRGEQEHIKDQSFFVTLLYMITIKTIFSKKKKSIGHNDVVL